MATNETQLLVPPSLFEIRATVPLQTRFSSEYELGVPQGSQSHGSSLAVKFYSLELRHRGGEKVARLPTTTANPFQLALHKEVKLEEAQGESRLSAPNCFQASSYNIGPTAEATIEALTSPAQPHADYNADRSSFQRTTNAGETPSSPSDDKKDAVSPSCTPNKRKRKMSPPPPSPSKPSKLPSDHDPLTWHESEITGHLITDPEDDGYGINGIGFKPTSATAHARARKRKQQVEEWKAREARQDRQRRMEKRHNNFDDDSHPSKVQAISVGDKCDSTEPKRAVRFA